MIWLALAGVLVILEMFSGTFYLLMIALGMVAGATAAWLSLAAELQVLLAALVGAAATAALRRRRPRKSDAARDPNINLDIGQNLHVAHWHDGTARVMYRGALWDVELGGGAIPEAGDFRIVEVQGNRLIVANS
jgi:membrane protein implicated in regulation of membrane protease activity